MKRNIVLWLLFPLILVSVGIALTISTFKDIETLGTSRERTAELISLKFQPKNSEFPYEHPPN